MADSPRPRDSSLDDAVDAAATRIARGESLDSVLRAYPQHADAMRAPLSALQPVLALPGTAPSPQSRANAAQAMFAALDAPTPQRASMLAGFWTALGARHLRLQAAAAGLAVLLFGGIGFASAAGDRSPVPVPGFLHVLAISSDNVVEIRGTIVALEADSLTLRTSSADEVVVIDTTTEIRIGEVRAGVADLALGQTARVRASRGVGGTLRAARIVAVAPTPATLDPNLVPELTPGTEDRTRPTSTDDRGHDGENARTPEPDESGDDGNDGATPQSDDGNSDDDGPDHDGPSPSATTDDGGAHEDSTKTPSPGDDAEPAAQSTESHSLEPTEAPEPTEKPEPTQKPEPTEDHN